MKQKFFQPFEIFVAAVVALWLLFCICSSPARCDEVDAARDRLKAIEAERQQAAEVAQAVLQSQADQLASVDLQPEPDPISERKAPSIDFQRPNSAASSERLPRAVLVCGPFCPPCVRIENELHGLVGDKSMPIQLVQNWLASDLEKWGVEPGMQLGTPYIFILDKDGKVHGLTPMGLGCVLRGYHNKEDVITYLQKPEHGVDVTIRSPQPESPTVATVADADASPDTFAAVLSAHLLEASGQQKTDEQYLYGGLFDFTIDAPESWKAIGSKILTAQKLEFLSAGITVDWTGPTRSFSVSKDKLTISPAVKVTLDKWFIRYTAALDGIEYTSDLSTVTMLLTGAPDLTVHLK